MDLQLIDEFLIICRCCDQAPDEEEGTTHKGGGLPKGVPASASAAPPPLSPPKEPIKICPTEHHLHYWTPEALKINWDTKKHSKELNE